MLGRSGTPHKLSKMGGVAAAVTVSIAAAVVPVGAQSPAADLAPSPRQDLAGVTLTVWDTTHKLASKDAVDAAFSAATGINLDYQLLPDPYEDTVAAKFAAGARPDIMWFEQGSRLPSLNPTENLRDLTDEAFASNYTPSLATAALYQGKRYGVMVEPPSIYSMLYNKQVLQDAGLEPPATFDELMTFCTALRAKQPDIDPVFIGGADAFPQLIVALLLTADLNATGFPDEVNTAKTTFSDPRFVAILEQMQTFFQSDCVNKDLLTATWDDEKAAIMSGRSALMPAGPWEVPELAGAYGGQEAVDQALGFAPFGNAAPHVVVDVTASLGNFYLPKTGDERQEAAALEYERYFTSPVGYQMYLDAAPVVPAFQGFDLPAGLSQIEKDARAAADTMATTGWDTALAASPTGYADGLSAIAAGTKTPQQVADEVTQAFQTNAKLVGLPGF